MSTKIYDSYKYNDRLDNLVNHLMDIGENFIETELKKKLLRYYRPFLKINYEYNNKIIKYLKDIPDQFTLSDFFENNRIGKTIHDDFILTIQVFFDKNDIYCTFYNVPINLIDDTLFTDFHYQNSTDMSNYDETNEPWNKMIKERQDELEKDWENRRIVWDRIYDRSWTPKRAGLSYEIDIFNDLDTTRMAFNKFKEILNDKSVIRKFKLKNIIK